MSNLNDASTRPNPTAGKCICDLLLGSNRSDIVNSLLTVKSIFRQQSSSAQSPRSCSHTLNRLQALLLLAIAYRGRNKDGVGWQMLGIAIRIAHTLGLHKHSTIKPSDQHAVTKKSEQLFHARIWAICCCLEKVMQLEAGRPSAIEECELRSNDGSGTAVLQVTISYSGTWASQKSKAISVSTCTGDIEPLHRSCWTQTDLIKPCWSGPIECLPSSDQEVICSAETRTITLPQRYQFNITRQ